MLSNDERLIKLAKNYLENKTFIDYGDGHTNGNFSLLVRRLAEDDKFRVAFMTMMIAILKDNPILAIDLALKAVNK